MAKPPGDHYGEALKRMVAEITPIKPEAVLAEVEDVLRLRPTADELVQKSDAAMAWLGRAKAALHHWDAVQATNMIVIEPKLHDVISVYSGHAELMALLNQARFSLRLRVEQESVVAGAGMVHEYFDGVRKIIESATSDLFFIDPYLDAEFVGRYLVYAKPGVGVRLLTKHKLKSLLPAVEMLSAQQGNAIQVRSRDMLHDRYVFVDSKGCFQSGASFKDGAKTAATAVIPITDASDALRQLYESHWVAGKIER